MEFRRDALRRHLIGDWQSWLATAALACCGGAGITGPEFLSAASGKIAATP